MERNKLTIKIVFSFLLDINFVPDAPALVFIMIFRSFWNSAVFWRINVLKSFSRLWGKCVSARLQYSQDGPIHSESGCGFIRPTGATVSCFNNLHTAIFSFPVFKILLFCSVQSSFLKNPEASIKALWLYLKYHSFS